MGNQGLGGRGWGVGHGIFSHYLGVGQQILYPWTGMGHEFLDLHFPSCSGPPKLHFGGEFAEMQFMTWIDELIGHVYL